MFKSLVNGDKRVKGSSAGRDCKNTIGYALYRSKKGGSQVCFSIGINLMKQDRIVIGDYLDIQLDEEKKRGRFKRVPDACHGYKLSTGTSKSYGRLHAPASIGPFPQTNGVMNLKNVIVDEDGISFDWPEEPKK